MQDRGAWGWWCEWPLQWYQGARALCSKTLVVSVGSQDTHREHSSLTVSLLSCNRWRRCMLCPEACMMDLCLI